MKLFIKRHNQKKKSNKYIRVKRIEPSFEIDPNNPIIVSQDLFGLMVEIDRTLKAHYIPSISFISDVMSAKTRSIPYFLLIASPILLLFCMYKKQNLNTSKTGV